MRSSHAYQDLATGTFVASCCGPVCLETASLPWQLWSCASGIQSNRWKCCNKTWSMQRRKTHDWKENEMWVILCLILEENYDNYFIMQYIKCAYIHYNLYYTPANEVWGVHRNHPICLSVCPSVCLSVCPSVCPE